MWSQVQRQLALVVDETIYRIWLEPLRPLELDGRKLLLQAPDQACRWTRERFGNVIQASVELVLGADAAVELVPSGDSGQRAGLREPAAPPGDAGAPHGPPQEPARTHHARRPDQLSNPKLTFDQFVIGDSNRLAHAAALAVAEMPAHAYNPLFVCGPPGVGKTHLLSAIANLLLTHNPGLTVRTTTGESFTNEFLTALAGGRADSFKLRFRDVDVLLLDDVQFLERKTRTEEEFFHTFNALHGSGRQLVLSSDRPPSDLQALEDRLRERFQAGLVADIAPPDLATRVAILRKRVQHDGVELHDDGALALIAERVRADVRALEGALIRVVAYGSLTGRPLTARLTREVLDSLYPNAPAGPPARTVAEIQAATCQLFGITHTELVSAARSGHIAWPRQLAMYLARELTTDSLPAIGRQFGGRDHTTVLHAWRRATARLATDERTREAVEKLRNALTAGTPTTHRDSHDRPS